MTMGELLTALRERCGLTQAQAARLLGWTRHRLWSYEHDRCAVPSPALGRLLRLVDPTRTSWVQALDLAAGDEPEVA